MKPTTKKKTRQQSLKSLKSEADKLLQQVYVPLNPECLVCGDPTSEMHHFVLKSQSANLRYDPKNVVPLCRSCHCKHHISGDSAIIADIIRIKGYAWNDDLQRRRHDICRINKGYLKELISQLEDIRED